MFIDPFYYIQRSFIDNNEAEYLVDILNNNSNNKLKASIENGSDYNIRSTNVYFMPDEIYSDFNNIFYTYCLNINNLLGWNFDITNTETVQLLEYKQGDFYKQHIDILNKNNKNQQRKITVVVFLSKPDTYEGGEFVLFDGGDEFSFRLDRGDAIVLPSFVPHEVRQVSGGTRYSLTAWISGPKWR